MRQKFIDKIYMRDVIDKEWYLEENKDINGYIALKYVKEISSPILAYCNGKKYVGLDNGYSILEYILLDKKYNCRVFFDKNNRPLLFYFDINNGCGIENNIPWYDDLYLDVTLSCPTITDSGYYIFLDDEREFSQAKKEGLIDEDLYIQGYETANILMRELREQKNEIVNRCIYDIYRIKKLLNI